MSNEIKSEVNIWVLFHIAIPFVVLALVWGYGDLYADQSFSFYKIFSSADLVLASALLSIGVFIELYKKLDSIDKSEFPGYVRVRNKSMYLLATTIILLIVYGGLKAASFYFNFPNATEDRLATDIIASASISIGSYILASLQVVNTKYEVIRMEYSR